MNALNKFIGKFDQSKFKILNNEMSFSEYVDLCYTNPKLLRNSWQIIFDMVIEKGFYPVEEYRKTYKHYNFSSRLKFIMKKAFSNTITANINSIKWILAVVENNELNLFKLFKRLNISDRVHLNK